MKLLDEKQISIGTCYYPEHWNPSVWEQDLARMLAVGIKTVRIAEFGWCLMEPAEGEFDFSLFDNFLDAAEKAGMQVIVGTPTATPPAWLTEKYPEVLNADVQGNLYRHGARRHYNYNSSKYQKLCGIIVEKMAQAYAGRNCVVGWQIDNELNCEVDEFYSESDTLAFRRFLKEKYGSVEKLNQAWGTVVWSQNYSSWDEVFVPRFTIHNTVNPHEVMDYKRFISDSCCRFAKMQSDILRKYVKDGDFITTNGMFGNLDNHRLREESLDVYMYDSYPNFAYCLEQYDEKDRMKDRRWSRNLAQTRAVSPVFGIMEQQSGANGWNTRMMAPTPEPGQMTLWTMQSIAHGADYVSFFRWRTATVGTEIYWHGILDYSGRENRRLAEVRAIGEMTEKMSRIAGARYKAKVGIVTDYDNQFDAGLDKWHELVERQSQKALFEACQCTHTPFDYCYIDHMSPEELAKYEVLFYMHPVIMTRERAELLEEYVKQGGKLVFGCRSAYKDGNGHCVEEKLPCFLQTLTGTDVTEYSMISPKYNGIVKADWDGTVVETAVFNDLLSPTGGGEVLARYSENYYQGEGALIRNRYGSGEAYYFGGAFTRDTAEVFLKKLGAAEPYGNVLTLPQCCELAVRAKGDKEYLFVLNYSDEQQEIVLQSALDNVLTGQKEQGMMKLEPYGIAVYELKNKGLL